jgi:hypothetical protein
MEHILKLYAALYFAGWPKEERRRILLLAGISGFFITQAEEWAENNSFNVKGEVSGGD